LGLVTNDKEDGSPIVLNLNFMPFHGTVLGTKVILKIRGEAPGIVSEYVDKRLEAAPASFY